MEISEAIAALEKFRGVDLTQTLANVESALRGLDSRRCSEALTACGAEKQVLLAAALMKQVSAQIDVVVHSLGILLCLPHLLQAGEVIEDLSIGAGNTGRAFDLETNQRVAEFKFIRWQGGPESIRQNGLFKDFFLLAEHPTQKRKHLYVLGTEHPLRFLNGGRALSRSSVLSGSVRLKTAFEAKYPQLKTVREYYLSKRDAILIQDVSHWVPDLIGTEDESG